MPANSASVRIVNFEEFYSSLRLLAPELHEQLRGGLRTVLNEIAQDARSYASAQGFDPPGRSGRGTGDLIGMIRVGLTAKKGYLVDRARHNDYPYPRLYEYSRGRPFFHPAISAGEGKIYAGVQLVLEKVIADWNAGYV